MNASLNELAEILAERTDRQFDTPFNEEMKVAIGYWRSRLLRDALEKNKKDRMYFRQYFEVPLIKVNISELQGFPNYPVLRTECSIPDPVRANGIAFDYIGSPDKLSNFKLFTEQHELIPALDAQYTGKRPKGLWLNGFIYIFNSLDLPYLGVSGVFDDPQAVSAFKCNCGCDTCFDDDSPYPISGDIQQRIIQAIMSTELHIQTRPNTEAIPVTKEDGADQT